MRLDLLQKLLSKRRKKLLVIGLLLALGGWIGWRGYRLKAGAPSDPSDASWTEGTRVLSRDGRLLGERPSTEGLRGRTAKLDDVSQRLIDATIASEDRSFYSHDGVDRFALVRAVLSFVTRGKIVSGGSTITMQLVKRIDHHGRPRPRTLGAKLSEMARAQNLEGKVDKRTILEAYLNKLDYGRGLAGPEAAAQGYFGVHARDLSLAQASLLAVLPRAPSALDPYRHRERAVLRQRALLQRMRGDKMISDADLDRALAEPLVLRDAHAPRPFLAPHVVVSSSARRTGDVRTTLDFDLQRDVEALVKSHVPRLQNHGASTAAVVVVDATTGDVLAEVSGPDWNDAKAGRVDLVRARRQAGSTLKPFVYARSFEKGGSPMEMLADVPTDFGTRGASYSPENFDGTFVGPISAREALAGSLNVPAVKLAAELGAANVVSTLRETGVPLPGGAERYGLSIALGSAEVTPLELAESYVTLARAGEHVPLRDRASDHPPRAGRVFDAAAAALVTDALADPLARVRGLRTRGPFELPFPVAVKTGTSTGYRDAWTAGYTHERVVVVWVGNADGSAARKLTGAVGAGPLFTDVMKRAMQDVTTRAPLFDHDLVEEADVCPLSGHRPGHACNTHVKRLFARGRAPAHACPIHAHADGSPLRCAPNGSQRVVVLPDAYQRWLDLHPVGAPGVDPYGTPFHLASRVPGCGTAIADEPRIVLVAPRDGSVVVGGNANIDTVDVDVETHGLPEREPLEVLVDGRLALLLKGPYRGRVGIGRGDHQVEVRPADPQRAALLGRAAFSVR